MSFPASDQSAVPSVALPAETGGILSGVAGMLNPMAGIMSGIGGISSMFGGGKSGMEISKAVSGGTFTTGDIGGSKSDDITNYAIIAAIILGLFLILRKK